MSTAGQKEAVSVLPFGIEIDHPRNSDVLLQCIPGTRLRSAISGTKGAVNARTGETVVPRDQTIHLGSFPQTPGMQVHVNPGELTYAIIDPMHGDEKLCDRVRKFLKDARGYSVSERFDGVPPQNGKLDVHQMKSLCRELLWLVQSGEAKKAKGSIPDLEDINELPGHFLLNPGSRVGNTQPRYEKDWDEWVDRLSRSGG